MKFFFSLLLFVAMISEVSCGEEPCISNVRQLTFSSMGFEKAGEAYFSPDEQMIIFQAVPKGEQNYQMYVMGLEEGIPRMVSTGRGSCTCGFFHPGGERILFASSHESDELPKDYKWSLTPYMNIYETNLDGSEMKKLTEGIAYHAEGSYSPDGSEVLYASNEDGSMNLYIMNSDGSNVRQLTFDSHCYNGGPFFSPDGKRVVFRADREKPDYLQIYTMNTDGSEELQVTNNGYVNWAPYWHPNGQVIAYTTSVHGHHRYEIYLLNTETGEQSRLTDSPSFDGLPVFNHDGSKIMWTSQRGEDRSCQLFIADFTLPTNLN